MNKSEKQQKFTKLLQKTLKDFEDALEWPDVSNWLIALQQLLNKYIALNCELSQKVLLTKRLAQCLSHKLPWQINQKVIKIYKFILRNSKNYIQSYSIVGIGIFSSFQHLTLQLKFEILDILEKYFVERKQSLILSFSIINILLIGLIEQNEEFAHKIYSLMEKFENTFTIKILDGTVWLNILKSPKTRLSGLKYMMKVLKERQKNIQRQARQPLFEGKHKMISNFRQQRYCSYSQIWNKNSESKLLAIFVDALIACLQENQILVKRTALEFMIKNSSINDVLPHQKEILIQACLQNLLIKQISITRRICNFVMGGNPDQQNFNFKKLDENLKLVQNILLTIFERQNTEIQKPILILQYLLNFNQIIIKKLLPKISYALIQYFYKNRFRKRTSNTGSAASLFNQLKIHVVLFLKSTLESILNKSQNVERIQKFQFFLFEHKNIINMENCSPEIFSDMIQTILKFLCLNVNNLQSPKQITSRYLQFCLNIISFYKQKFQILLNYETLLLIEDLINQNRMQQKIYGYLLEIHPKPSHQLLLPYIREPALSFLIIKRLIKSPIQLDEKEKDEIFINMFRILEIDDDEINDKLVPYIVQFQNKYPQNFKKNILLCTSSTWKIYWKKMDGKVNRQSLVKMLNFLIDENLFTKNICKVWLDQYVGTHLQNILMPLVSILQNQNYYSEIDHIFHIINQIIDTYPRKIIQYINEEKIGLVQLIIDTIFNKIYKLIDPQEQQQQSYKIKQEGLSLILIILKYSQKSKSNIFKIVFTKIPKIIKKILQSGGQNLFEIEFIDFVQNFVNQFNISNLLNQKSNPKLIIKIQDSELNDFLQVILYALISSNINHIKQKYIQIMIELTPIFKILLNQQQLEMIINIILQKFLIFIRQTNIQQLKLERQSQNFINFNVKHHQSVYLNHLLAYEQQSKKIIEILYGLKFYILFSIENHFKDSFIQTEMESILTIIINSLLQSKMLSTIMKSQQQKQMEPKKNLYKKLLQEDIKKQYLTILKIIWEKYGNHIVQILIRKNDPKILVEAEIDINQIMHIVKQTKLNQIIQLYSKNKIILPQTSYRYFNIEILKKQNQLLHFLYNYIKQIDINKNKFELGYFMTINVNSLKDINKITVHMQTKLWILEIIYSLLYKLTKKLKEDLLKEVFLIIFEIYDIVVEIILKKIIFTTQNTIKNYNNNVMNQQQQHTLKVFELVQEYPISLKEYITQNKVKVIATTQLSSYQFANLISQVNVWIIQKINSVFLDITKYKQGHIQQSFYLQFVKKILKHISGEMISSKKVQLDVNLVQRLIRILLQMSINGIKDQETKKFIKSYTNQIFLCTNFFKTNKNTLSAWKSIINSTKQNFDSTKQLENTKLMNAQIKMTKKLLQSEIQMLLNTCFIIYSDPQEKYLNSVKKLMVSLFKCILNYSISEFHNIYVLVIIFSMKIFAIKLMPNDPIFQDISVTIFSILLECCQSESTAIPQNTSLFLMILKLVEILNIRKIQYFSRNKWILLDQTIKSEEQLQEKNNNNNKKQDEIYNDLLKFVVQNDTKLFINLLPDGYFNLTAGKLETNLKNLHLQRFEQPQFTHFDKNVNKNYTLLQHFHDQCLKHNNQPKVPKSQKQIEELLISDFIFLSQYITELFDCYQLQEL